MNLLDFLISKQDIHTSGLLRGMTDTHSHLLPGVDDGVQTEEESLKALQVLKMMGINCIWLTPHVMDVMPANYKESFKKAFTSLLSKKTKDIKIQLAAEYMIDANFYTHLEQGLLTYSDRKVLVETSYAAPPFNLEEMLYELNLEGYTPVIAHPERYNYMSDNFYHQMKKKGYLFQMNLLSITGYYGRTAAKKTAYFLKKGYYDFVGSDIHNLKKFKKGLERISLTKREIVAIRKLMDNNHHMN